MQRESQDNVSGASTVQLPKDQSIKVSTKPNGGS